MKLGVGRDGNTSTDGRAPVASGADHSTPSVVALHHVRVPVSDVLVSQDWYSEVLGFRPTLVVEEENAVTGVVSVHPSGVVVGLHSAPQQARALAGFAVIGLSVDDLRDWVAHLDSLGVSHSGITDGHLGECVRLSDPDGLVIELHTPSQPSADGA
jgi:catechol 2,3-dioxygenase-like lactoylglutathione lyase family enzyme